MSEHEHSTDPELDGEIGVALAELGESIGDSYLSSFASKVAARLEVEVMETSPRTGAVSDEMPFGSAPPAADTENRDENSGLHEIKELASSTKRRLARRRTTQNDIQDQLLTSSSNALPVVLPQPGKSQKMQQIISIDSKREQQKPATVRSAHHEPPKSRAGLWLAGVAMVAAAAAVAVFMIKSNASSDAPAVAAGEANVAEATAATPAQTESPAAPARSTAEKASAGAATESGATADQPVVAALGSNDLGNGSSNDPGAAPAKDAKVALGGTLADRDDSSDKSKRQEAEKKAAKKEKERVAREDAKSKPADEKDVKAGAAKKPDTSGAGGAAGPTGGKKSIDQILDGVGSDDVAPVEPEKEERKVDKNRLDQGDLRRAMRRVSVKSCQAKTGYIGRITVKFSVSPSGRVTKAKAVGAKDAAAGRCVAASVKRAKFPTFNPPSMSFSYPFMLDE